jgi:hypothetical protein
MSQVEAVETQIGESKYEMYMLAPMVSHGLLMDVGKMVGPAIGPVLDALFSKAGGENKIEQVMDQEIGADFFSSAAKALFENINKKTLADVINAFKTVTHVDGMPLDKIFDAYFMGKLDEMYRWLFWGMRVQWGKSLSALGTEAAVQSAKIKAPPSPSPST